VHEAQWHVTVNGFIDRPERGIQSRPRTINAHYDGLGVRRVCHRDPRSPPAAIALLSD
jgi:hypothetical protein